MCSSWKFFKHNPSFDGDKTDDGDVDDDDDCGNAVDGEGDDVEDDIGENDDASLSDVSVE